MLTHYFFTWIDSANKLKNMMNHHKIAVQCSAWVYSSQGITKIVQHGAKT